jgi:serine protease Do
MDKKGVLILLLILTGGIMLGNNWNKIIRKAGYYASSPGAGIEYANDGTPGVSDSIIMLQNSFAGTVKIAKPSIVNISAVHIVEVESPFYQFYFGDPFEDFFGRPKRRKTPVPEKEKYRYEGTGSGFIVNQKGYVLTNYHVIKDAAEIKVTTYDNKKYEAEVVGRDPKTDLAVVKIKSSRKFNALVLGDSNNIQVGDWVMAAGSPFGLQQTYTAGIISAVRQDVQVENLAYRDMLQTDAAINRGNSGGPLIDLQGRVVGINTAIFAPTGVFSGIGFAIPINQAKNVLDELIEKGRVVRGWLGVEIKDVDEAVKLQFNLQDTSGVLVNKVLKNSGAEKGGIKRGDVIVAINEDKIKNSRDLSEIISSSDPGQKLKITVIRGGQKQDVEVILGEMPDTVEEISKAEKKDKKTHEVICQGIKVSNITEEIIEYYDISVSKGVIVLEIDNTQDCYDIGLHTGDVILEINRVKITNAADFEKIMKKVDLSKGVVFDIIRNGKPLYLSYRKSR